MSSCIAFCNILRMSICLKFYPSLSLSLSRSFIRSYLFQFGLQLERPLTFTIESHELGKIESKKKKKFFQKNLPIILWPTQTVVAEGTQESFVRWITCAQGWSSKQNNDEQTAIKIRPHGIASRWSAIEANEGKSSVRVKCTSKKDYMLWDRL